MSCCITCLLVCFHQSQAQKIVDDLFPPGVDMDVDGLVTTLAQEMIDEFPASDPRWAESVHQGTLGSK